jgi:hypothetical protein
MIIGIYTILADPLLRFIFIHQASLAVCMYARSVAIITKIHLIIIVISTALLAIRNKWSKFDFLCSFLATKLIYYLAYFSITGRAFIYYLLPM